MSEAEKRVPLERHCVCGSSMSGEVRAEEVEKYLEYWNRVHMGDGHGETDAATAQEQRKTLGAERFSKRAWKGDGGPDPQYAGLNVIAPPVSQIRPGKRRKRMTKAEADEYAVALGVPSLPEERRPARP